MTIQLSHILVGLTFVYVCGVLFYGGVMLYAILALGGKLASKDALTVVFLSFVWPVLWLIQVPWLVFSVIPITIAAFAAWLVWRMLS